MATHVRRRPTTDSKRRFWVAIQHGSRMATHIRCRPKTGNQRKRRRLSNTCSPCYLARVSSKLKGKAPSWVCKQPSKCGSCCMKLCMTIDAACVQNTRVSTRQQTCTPYLSSGIIDYEIRKKRFVCLQLQFKFCSAGCVAPLLFFVSSPSCDATVDARSSECSSLLSVKAVGVFGFLQNASNAPTAARVIVMPMIIPIPKVDVKLVPLDESET